MDTVRYKINNNEFGHFVVNTSTNKIIDLDENSEEYKEYLSWINLGNTPKKWNTEV